MSTDVTTVPSAQDEVVQICKDLIRIDTSNYGDRSGPGERVAAEYIMAKLTEVGLDPELRAWAPALASVVVRTPGRASRRAGLVPQGCTGGGPAGPGDWEVEPFSAGERDGCMWGRGAVDMADIGAMLLANVRHLARTGQQP